MTTPTMFAMPLEEFERDATDFGKPSLPLLPIIHHPDYHIPNWPADHNFPMNKFHILHQLLVDEGFVRPAQVFMADTAPRGWVEYVHERQWLDAVISGEVDAKTWRKVGLPWSEALAQRSLAEVGGTVATCRLAMRHGLCVNTAGGTHHAFADKGSAYCVLNDLAVATRVMQAEGRAQRIAIVDLDVHQGDGTAAIFRSDPDVFTFSLHCQDNFPSIKQRSDLDVGLPKGTNDEGYLSALMKNLPLVIKRANPELVIYDAGVDIHQDDRLGHFNISDNGIKARDRYVLRYCRSRNLPLACVIGGGYDRDPVKVAQRHSILFKVASDVWTEEHTGRWEKK